MSPLVATSMPSATAASSSSLVSPTTPKTSSLHEILQEESQQSLNLSRAQAKPFHVTQIEEKAMAELRAFYNADQVFDEFIIVQRVEEHKVLATPIWNRNK